MGPVEHIDGLLISREEMIRKINGFSVQNQPFFCYIDFRGEIGFIITPEEAEKYGILYAFEKPEIDAENRLKKAVNLSFSCPDEELYRNSFEKVMYHLKRGDTYLLNLTFPTPVRISITPEEIFTHSNAPFRLLVPGKFVVFSPEPFVRIENGLISSNPMKGTIDATLPDAEAKLLADEKEFFEHNTIVDLIRNDLSMVSTGVNVARFRYIDRIRTHRGELLQMSSEITGKLDPDYRQRMGDILFTLLPAGSISGAPKKRTLEIIEEVETDKRGFYTGIFGYFDGNVFRSAVSIRFIEISEQGMTFRSGGGITARSYVSSEFSELMAKIYVPIV